LEIAVPPEFAYRIGKSIIEGYKYYEKDKKRAPENH
jgi:hypothetical protein